MKCFRSESLVAISFPCVCGERKRVREMRARERTKKNSSQFNRSDRSTANGFAQVHIGANALNNKMKWAKKKSPSPFKMMNDLFFGWQKHINTRFISGHKSKSKIFLVINTSFSLFAASHFDPKRIHVCRIRADKIDINGAEIGDEHCQWDWSARRKWDCRHRINREIEVEQLPNQMQRNRHVQWSAFELKAVVNYTTIYKSNDRIERKQDYWFWSFHIECKSDFVDKILNNYIMIPFSIFIALWFHNTRVFSHEIAGWYYRNIILCSFTLSLFLSRCWCPFLLWNPISTKQHSLINVH